MRQRSEDGRVDRNRLPKIKKYTVVLDGTVYTVYCSPKTQRDVLYEKCTTSYTHTTTLLPNISMNEHHYCSMENMRYRSNKLFIRKTSISPLKCRLYVFWTVDCNIIIQYRLTKCTSSKLIF